MDVSTRNVEVEAILANPDRKILPGMYGVVEINTGVATEYLTVPQTAISYNPYGNLVYILKENHRGLGTGFANFMSGEIGQLIFKRAYLAPSFKFLSIRPVKLNE